MIKKKTRNVLLGLVAILIGVNVYHRVNRHHPSIEHMAQGTVMITNLAKNSGGSGVILLSTPAFSRILTNGHVCEVTKNGGYVITESGDTHVVTLFIKSHIHDLCLLEVASDLHVNTEVAPQAPQYLGEAHIIGHPHLYPTIMTHGHFSGKKTIAVSMGVRECTEEEFKDPDTGLFCVLAGGIPIIKTFESILVSATIMPGSSGSAIYNSSGQVSALVFAGNGDLGYSFSVPYEYIALFLNVEIAYLRPTKPNMDHSTSKNQPQNSKDRFTKACNKAYTKYQYEVCKIVLDDDRSF